ncbi:hypothetical protein RchiOBHm_Chr4g0418391 [Rosa chinensis]|uniref:Uncharacterized protein n=1 Tax=Rosa chinensis TaxID=74649 RepID=A0A2P6QXB2_ROSCH|nr:hypothetical protein RchiOBHm_Chr4g0418391 [Rosa chinensis]
MCVLLGPKVCKRCSYTLSPKWSPNRQGDKRTRCRDIFEFQVMGYFHNHGPPLLEKRPSMSGGSPEKFA